MVMTMTRPAVQMPLAQQIARMDAGRLRAYRENLEFYQGRQWADPTRRRERRLTLNYAKAVIEKTASYTMSGLSFVVDPEDGSAEAGERARRAERALREIHAANNLEQLEFDNEIDCSVLGDAAYKVTWDAAEKEAEMLYGALGTTGRAGLKPAPTRGNLSEHTIVEVWTDADFELWIDGAPFESRENPYGFIPFVIYPNVREPKQFWGVSDLVALKEPLRELNRAMSQLSLILELSGNPIAVLENVTEAQDIAVQPGAVWEIPEKARAYLLDLLQGGGVGLHVEFANLLLRTFHDLAEVPRSAFGETKHALSGVALQMELDPLLKKVERKRLIRGAALRRRNEMALRILEQYTTLRQGSLGPGSGQAARTEGFAPYRSRAVWGPVLPQDRSRLVEDEARLVAGGIHSRRTAAGLLDVADPDGEWSRWREEEREMGNEK